MERSKKRQYLLDSGATYVGIIFRTRSNFDAALGALKLCETSLIVPGAMRKDEAHKNSVQIEQILSSGPFL